MAASTFRVLVGTLIWFCLFTARAGEELTVIHVGHLLGDPGRPVAHRQSIVVADQLIRSVEAGFVNIEGAEVIDLSAMWVLPGLIDLHVHLTSDPAPESFEREETATANDLLPIAASNAQRNLRAGFTTVLDMGTGLRNHAEAIEELKRRIASDQVNGPRVLSVGAPLSSPGFSRKPSSPGLQGVCVGAAACASVVEEQVRQGADIINFYNTGSLLSRPSKARTFSDEEMQAIVQTASKLNRRVIADGGNTPDDPSGIVAAVNAGVDVVDTVSYADDQTIRLLRDKEVFLVPHLYALQAAVGPTRNTLSAGTMGWLPEEILELLWELGRKPQPAKRAFEMGVTIAFGSDPGVFPHGDNAGEFLELVKLGMTPAQAIATATTNAAALLDLTDQIGTIDVGKFADVIAVTQNPLRDIRALQQVEFVMRAGKRVSMNRADEEPEDQM